MSSTDPTVPTDPSVPPSDPYRQGEPDAMPGPASGRSLVRGLAVGGGVALLAVGGAGAWAWTALGGGGERPADVLPATTFAYVAVDLDPAAGQKLEALRTLAKFPGLTEAGLSEDDDLATALTDVLLSGEPCTNLDAARDITPWLGQRGAVAAVTLGEKAVPVGVVQVTDEEAAKAGLLALAACAENDDADATDGVEPTWALRDGWAVIAEDAGTASRVADAAQDATLAASNDFTRWTQEVGDQGVLTAYLAPKPGSQLRSLMTRLAPEDLPAAGVEAFTAPYDEFEGGAVTLRFADGGLDHEDAAGHVQAPRAQLGTGGGTSLAALPDDTLAAFGAGFAEGWVEKQASSVAAQSGGELDADELYQMIEEQTGLSLPADLETLFGRTVVVSLGSGFDPAVLEEAEDPSALPLAVKVTGDQAGIEGVVGRLADLDPVVEQLLGTTRAGSDTVVVGPSEAYRDVVAKGGRLGDTATFRDVVPNADRAVAAFYLDVDGKDDWLTSLAGDDPEVARNIAPLSAVGMSVWSEGDTLHTRLRVATD